MAVSVRVPALSSTRAGAESVSVGSVPAAMVAVAVAGVPRAALSGFESVSVNASAPSAIWSAVTGTVTVCVVVPGANLRLPLVGVKSSPLVAVPPSVAKPTVTVRRVSPVRTAVNVASAPSWAATSPVRATVGSASSSAIVTVALGVAMVPSDASEKATVNVSASASSASSGVRSTDNVALVWPAAMVTTRSAKAA